MSLEAASHDPACWRPRCDGRLCDGRLVIDSGVTMPFVSCSASEQPCLGVALLSPNGEGNKKRFLKKADPNPTCPQTAAGWSSNTAVETIH